MKLLIKDLKPGTIYYHEFYKEYFLRIKIPRTIRMPLMGAITGISIVSPSSTGYIVWSENDEVELFGQKMNFNPRFAEILLLKIC